MTAVQTNGLSRLTPQETEALLQRDAAALYTVSLAGKRANDDPNLVEMSPPTAVAQPPVSLPVTSTARIAELRSESAATGAAISHGYTVKRTPSEKALAGELATLAQRWKEAETADEELSVAVEARKTFVDNLPPGVLRRIGQRVSRVSKVTPWAMWFADTTLMANPYGLFGAVALPFPASAWASNAIQLLRAAAVAFGLTFGLKMVGGRLRDLADDAREQHPAAGFLADGAIIAVVVSAAVMLASSAAQLQQAFLSLTLGGTEVHVPTSVLLAIVMFLGAVSFATGYFTNEPQLAEVAQLDADLKAARETAAKSVRVLSEQRGVVRARRVEIASLREQERHELAEHQAHGDRRVFAHMAGNVPLYGLQIDSSIGAVPGSAS